MIERCGCGCTVGGLAAGVWPAGGKSLWGAVRAHCMGRGGGFAEQHQQGNSNHPAAVQPNIPSGCQQHLGLCQLCAPGAAPCALDSIAFPESQTVGISTRLPIKSHTGLWSGCPLSCCFWDSCQLQMLYICLNVACTVQQFAEAQHPDECYRVHPCGGLHYPFTLDEVAPRSTCMLAQLC